MSYSQVAAAAAVPSPAQRIPERKSTVNNVVIISPKIGSEIETSEGVKDSVLRTVMPKLSSVKVRNIRRLSDKRILVETDSARDKEKLEDYIKNNHSSVQAESPRKIGPKLIIFDVKREMTNEVILKELYQRNVAEFGVSKQDFEKDVHIRFKSNTKSRDERDEERCNVILEVSGRIRLMLLQKERVFVEFGSHRVRDFELVTRCYRCLGYGHTSKFCNGQETCSHCAGHGHKKIDCPKTNDTPKCANCLIKKKSGDHTIFDTTCPEYKRALDFMRNRTAYD